MPKYVVTVSRTRVVRVLVAAEDEEDAKQLAVGFVFGVEEAAAEIKDDTDDYPTEMTQDDPTVEPAHQEEFCHCLNCGTDLADFTTTRPDKHLPEPDHPLDFCSKCCEEEYAEECPDEYALLRGSPAQGAPQAEGG